MITKAKSAQIPKMKNQIAQIQSTADSNKLAADDALKKQTAASKKAQEETKRLRDELASYQKLHINARAKMVILQQKNDEAQAIAD